MASFPRRSPLHCLALVSALLATGVEIPSSPAEEAGAKEKRVLVFGIDGLRPDALAKAETPHLDRLIADGAFSDNALVSGPSAARGRVEGSASLVDIVPTALTHLGIQIDPRWELDGQPIGLK